VPHYTTDRCTRCGSICSPELLTIMRVSFSPRTKPSKIVKSRTVAWLCEDCLGNEPTANLPAYKGAPGMTSEALERVRRGEVQ
jgi:hypothetical protein